MRLPNVFAIFLALAIAAGAPAVLIAATPASKDASLNAADQRWIQKNLEAMSLEEKAAQMLMVRSFGHPLHPNSWEAKNLIRQVRDMKVGGICVFASEAGSVPRIINTLQENADVPLIIAADSERGMSFRIPEGVAQLPYAMAIGATRSAEMARFVGEVTARESRALGIHWAFAPVVDVNVNPLNPVIHVRSYGEDPDLVSELAAAYIEGVRSGGALSTAKHFPGHGDTAIDSHFSLPTIHADRQRLDEVELAPFRHVIDAGVDAVMVGHLAVPALDPSSLPATLSPPMVDQLLRRELGFDGLIVTDAMEMEGVGDTWVGAATIAAVLAGADVVALPPDPRVALQSLVRAVREGQLTEERLDSSVRRILTAKARLGLHKKRQVDLDAAVEALNQPKDIIRAQKIARSSVTVVRNDGDVLPIDVREPVRLLHVTLTESVARILDRGLSSGALRARASQVVSQAIGTEVSRETADDLVARADEMTHIVVSATFFRRAPSPSQMRLLRRLQATGRPLIVVSLGSPYLLTHIPEVDVYVTTYGDAEPSRAAAVEALFGEIPTLGKLPVTLPDLYPIGHGLEIPRTKMILENDTASDREGDTFKTVDQTVEGFINAKAFPGAVLAVGHRGRLVHLKPYGKLSYDANAVDVKTDTIYDLASLTKVVATTTMAMIMVDEGRLNLDATVQSYLPNFRGEGKDAITVRHLMTHSSGIDWWAPLYEKLKGQEAYVNEIQAMPLAYETGTATKYSDLGIILLGEILERVSGRSLDGFVGSRVFRPLGMNDTLFRPDPAIRARVAPTEEDAWRGRMVRGEVHDENAFALGGVAPHAGLFGTAPDLAKFMQMLMNGGVYGQRRLIKEATVEMFTKPAAMVEGSTRALGWDTRSPERSSAGTLMSSNAWGHTGFTGTSIWVDPERELFVILLTNRVHPTRENKAIRKARPAIADAVVRALGLEAETSKKSEKPKVIVGLERLEKDGDPDLRGQRLGLVVHAASVTADGRHAIDVLRDQKLDVIRLFSPEHGLRGRAAAGEKVESGRDPKSGLPVVSLYGEKRQPSAADLEGLDALVFDLQGAGVRFYTYVSTMILSLKAAAAADIDFVVLDRPNPLGGNMIAGPLSAPRGIVPESFVNMAPGPLVHGLTLGEMARYVNAGLEKPAKLHVVPMVGWKRSMTWTDTELPWVSPSPNLRSPDAALAYPGVGLLEATNVSEGRGTEEPFLYLGAPWLTVGERTSGGFDLLPSGFTPKGSAAAPNPKFKDEPCQGWNVRVRDRSIARGYALGLDILVELSQREGFEWRRDGAALTWLLGTPRVYEALRAGRSAQKILEADLADHAVWRVERRAALLY